MSDYAARLRDEIQLAKTLFVVCLLFILLWMPYACVVIMDIDDNFSKIVYVIVVQLAHGNSSVNCIVYPATNRQFRQAYKLLMLKVFCCQCRKGSPDRKNGIVTSMYNLTFLSASRKLLKTPQYTPTNSLQNLREKSLLSDTIAETYSPPGSCNATLQSSIQSESVV